MSLLDKSSLIVTPNAYKASKLYSVVPSSGAGDMTVVRATTATKVNSLGLIESVANNVPRIDYTNGSCPSLLVEPQRTNLLTYSEQLDNNDWFKNNVNITSNSTISPDGSTSADTVSITTLRYGLFRLLTVSPNTSYTFSFYVKKGTNTSYIYNITDGVTFTNLANFDYSSQLDSNWKRISVSFTTGLTTTTIRAYPLRDGSSTGTAFIWGAQLEAGSYATSYIPTVATTVTRNADVISKTGISSLIGTEFTLFLDGFESIGGNSSRYLILKGAGGTYNNYIAIEGLSENRVGFYVYNSLGSLVFGASTGSVTNGQIIKLAARCKNNDFAFYVNGTLIGNQLSGTVPTTADLYLGYYTDYADNYNKINSTIIFNTGLTNTELAQLTTL